MTPPAIVEEFVAAPSLLRGYLRAAASRAAGLPEGAAFPSFLLRLRGVRASPQRLRRYREVCGFADDGALPLPYPQVLATPLHLALLTHPAFPFKPAGIVHLRNRFAQHAPLADDAALDLQVRAHDHRRVEQGIEFDLVTEAADAHGRPLWESVTTSLVRDRRRERAPSGPRPPNDFGAYRVLDRWPVPAAAGRAYAAASGDWNPIHLHALSARAMGFPRAIAHGMWSFARCLAALDRHGLRAPRWQVAFKRPLLLPGAVVLHVGGDAGHPRLLLSDRSGETMHLAAEAEHAPASGDGVTRDDAPRDDVPGSDG